MLWNFVHPIVRIFTALYETAIFGICQRQHFQVVHNPIAIAVSRRQFTCQPSLPLGEHLSMHPADPSTAPLQLVMPLFRAMEATSGR
jgi:hypothetical protein